MYERALELDGRRLATTPALHHGARLPRRPAPRDPARAVPVRCTRRASASTRARHRRVPHAARTGGGRRRQRTECQRRGSSSTTGRRARARWRSPGDPAEAFTAHPSGFTGEDVTYDYRWERCGDGGCVEIGGAVSRTYRVGSRTPGSASAPSSPPPTGAGRSASPRRRAPRSRSRPRRRPARSLGTTQPRGRLTAWLERGRRHLRHTTVTWPTRVRIRGRLTDLSGRPLAAHPGADTRAHDRRPLAPDHRRAHAPRRPADDVHADRPVAPAPPRPRRRAR